MAEGIRHLMRHDSAFTIRPRPDAALASWLLAFRRSCDADASRRTSEILTDLSRASMTLYDELDAAGTTSFGYRRGPLLNAYESEGWRDHAKAFADELASLGFSSTVLDRDEVLDLEPALSASIRGALLMEGQGSGDCYAYVRSLAEGLPGLGVTVRTGTPARRILTKGRAVVGVLAGEPLELIEADLVVLAAGAWTPPLARQAGVRLPIQPATGYSATMPTWDGAPSTPVFLDEAHVILLPLGDRLRFAGTLELAGFRTRPDPIRSRAVARAGRRALREPPTAGGDTWFGFRPLMPDDLPAIGWAGKVDNLIVAAGHGTLGFTQSPITGTLVAQLATGTTPSLPLEPFDPARFTRRGSSVGRTFG
jgi:D-amino-acid dehydrogenase